MSTPNPERFINGVPVPFDTCDHCNKEIWNTTDQYVVTEKGRAHAECVVKNFSLNEKQVIDFAQRQYNDEMIKKYGRVGITYDAAMLWKEIESKGIAWGLRHLMTIVSKEFIK